MYYIYIEIFDVYYNYCWAAVVVIECKLELQLPMQSVTTKAVSSNPAHNELYSI